VPCSARLDIQYIKRRGQPLQKPSGPTISILVLPCLAVLEFAGKTKREHPWDGTRGFSVLAPLLEDPPVTCCGHTAPSSPRNLLHSWMGSSE
jgi:hypothetical protein